MTIPVWSYLQEYDNEREEILALFQNQNIEIISALTTLISPMIQTKEDLLLIMKKTKIKTFLIGESLLKNLKNNSIFSVL